MALKGAKRDVGSGRKKGTPNKKSISLIEKAEDYGVDPFEILLMYAKGDWQGLGYDDRSETRYSKSGEPYYVMNITTEHRLRAASEACQYLHPKRKALEIKEDLDPDEDRPLRHLTDEELDKL